MKINMQVTLEEDDIKEAIRTFVLTSIPGANDQEVDINLFRSNDLIYASAVIGAENIVSLSSGPSEEEKPKRTRRTKAQIEADNAAAAAAGASPEPESSEEEQEQSGDEPWATTEVPAKPEVLQADAGNIFAEAPAEDTTEVVVVKPAIFPAVGSSAPALPKTETPPPPLNGKSLFANLGQPTAN